MADTELYETDILAWSEQQAAALRELAARRDLPNALDLAHVVEEIEGVGQSELNAVASFVRLLLVHALKCALLPDAPSVEHWCMEISNWQDELEQHVTPSMKHRIDLDVPWKRATRRIMLDFQAQRRDSALIEKARALRGTPCPFFLDDLLPEAATPAELVARLANVL